MNQRPEIIAALRLEVQTAPAAELPSIIGQIEAVKAEAFARLVTPAPAEVDEDKLMTVDEVAATLGETSRWVRDHVKDLPRVALPGRTLRFSGRRLADLLKRPRRG